MNNLKNINWLKDDGVNLDMINDFDRNRFYENLIGDHAKDQKCTDVGFGTGLLSIIAVKYGAEHVRAFEVDEDRYMLACEIVDRLKLKNKIELINERFDSKSISTPITFSETVDCNLWGEGLYKSLPIHNETLFLPSEYITEIHSVEISKNFVIGLLNDFNDYSSRKNNFFAPGIDLPEDFVNLISEFSNTKTLPSNFDWSSNTILEFPYQNNTVWGVNQYRNLLKYGEISASCSISKYSPSLEEITFIILTERWHNSNVLITPRFALRHNRDKLYLDEGCWGPGNHPVILINPTKNLKITQSLSSGALTYSFID